MHAEMIQHPRVLHVSRLERENGRTDGGCSVTFPSLLKGKVASSTCHAMMEVCQST